LGFIVLQKLAHPPARRIEQHIAKSEELVLTQRYYVEYWCGRDILEAKRFPVFGEDQVIIDGSEAFRRSDLFHKRSQVIVVPEKCVEAMIYFGRKTVPEGDVPAADFAAEVVIPIEEGYPEPSLGKQGGRGDARQPRANDSDFLGRLNGFRLARIDVVDDSAIAIEFFSYPRLQKALKQGHHQIVREMNRKGKLSSELLFGGLPAH
jgi:hypothetical protein